MVQTERRFVFLKVACVTAMLFSSVTSAKDPADISFSPLLDGRTLSGWIQRGGTANYTVEDGVIVGTAVPDTPNSFLCTERLYCDFILELDFWVDSGLNSGVQIRSNAYETEQTIEVRDTGGEIRRREIPAGRVHGYQVEIDPSDRAWTGGIYDEARRGWLADLSENKPAREAFRPDRWNHFRIEAIGDSVRTWLNDLPAAQLKDDVTHCGFIALQVHGVGNHPERVGLKVRWRNIRIKDLAPRESPRAAASGTTPCLTD